MKRLLQEIRSVKPQIREFVLQNYIKQCRKKHAIAFIEWRLHFSKMRAENDSSTQMEDDEIQEIITDRI